MKDTEYMKAMEAARIQEQDISDAHSFVAKGMFCLVLSAEFDLTSNIKIEHIALLHCYMHVQYSVQ